jgi:hypothetical protein
VAGFDIAVREGNLRISSHFHISHRDIGEIGLGAFNVIRDAYAMCLQESTQGNVWWRTGTCRPCGSETGLGRCRTSRILGDWDYPFLDFFLAAHNAFCFTLIALRSASVHWCPLLFFLAGFAVAVIAAGAPVGSDSRSAMTLLSLSRSCFASCKRFMPGIVPSQNTSLVMPYAQVTIGFVSIIAATPATRRYDSILSACS